MLEVRGQTQTLKKQVCPITFIHMQCSKVQISVHPALVVICCMIMTAACYGKKKKDPKQSSMSFLKIN